MLAWLRFRFLFTSALGLALSAGCADGTTGALEQAEVAVDCSPDDLACADLGLERPLAVGAHLTVDVAMVSPGSGSPPMGLASAAPDVIAVDGGTITGVGEGFAALLFVAANDGGVVDFVHVYAQNADALAIAARGEAAGEARALEGRVQLLVGDDLLIFAEARREGRPLGGEMEATWEATSDAVSLLETGFAGERRLSAREPGVTEIVVRALGLEVRAEVEVLP